MRASAVWLQRAGPDGPRIAVRAADLDLQVEGPAGVKDEHALALGAGLAERLVLHRRPAIRLLDRDRKSAVSAGGNNTVPGEALPAVVRPADKPVLAHGECGGLLVAGA